jgi:hypothetical protein
MLLSIYVSRYETFTSADLSSSSNYSYEFHILYLSGYLDCKTMKTVAGKVSIRVALMYGSVSPKRLVKTIYPSGPRQGIRLIFLNSR